MPKSIKELRKEISTLQRRKRDKETRKRLEMKLQGLKGVDKKQRGSAVERLRGGRQRFRKKHPRFTSFMDQLASG